MLRKGGMKTTQDQRKKGFTIIEVVLVLAIAGLIFLIVFLAVPALQRSQRDTQRRNDVSRLQSQLTQYQSNNTGNVPDTQAEVDDLKSRYLTAGGDEFKDPTTGNAYTVTRQTSISTYPASDAYGTIYYYNDAKCSGESLQDGNGTRSVAVVTPLEGGARFCQDNS